MSKNKPGVGGDRKGDGLGESEVQHMISTQLATTGLAIPSTRPSITLQAQGSTYIVQPQNEMKSFGKSARPIAPAPSQAVPARNVQPSQANIPSIISPTLVTGTSEGAVTLNLGTTTASTGQSSITVPVTLTQANILHLSSNSGMGNSSLVPPQGLTGSAIPITMLRPTGTTQPSQHPGQAFNQNYSHLPRGTTTLSVPKSTTMLRPVTSPLQIPGGLNTGATPMSLPLARAPLHSTLKTTMPQATRSQSPAVGGQPTSQVQPQDLSRGNVGPHSMQITLNRMNAPVNQDSTNIQGRTLTAQVQNDANTNIQQRISVSLSTDTNMQRITADLNRTTLPFSSQMKVNHPTLGPQAKVISPQTLSQQGATIKSTLVTAQRQPPISSIPIPTVQTSALVSSSSSLPGSSVPSVAPALHGSMSVSTLPASLPSPLSSSSMSSLPSSTHVGDSGVQARQEHPSVPSSQSTGIIINSDFQIRPPGSIITMTTQASAGLGNASATIVSQAENRSSNHNQQQIGMGPEDSMWYQHFVYHQVSQPTMGSQSTSAIVRPATNTFAFLPSQAKLQSQNPNIAATHLAAMSAASSSNVRFSANPMMMVDQLRQQQPQQHQLHSAFSTCAANTGGTSDKANLSSRATVASSIYTASVGVQSQLPNANTNSGSSGPVGNLSAVPVTNPSSSPRPSILRKRPSDAVVIRKPNFNLNQDTRCHSPPRLEANNASSVSSPKVSTKNFSPVSENSQSSTDTALSSNDALTPTHNHTDKGKDGDECAENGPSPSVSLINNIPASPAVSHTGSLSEASPRKRARKQLLHANEEKEKIFSSSEDEMENNSLRHRTSSIKEHRLKEREIRGEYTDDEGVRWVLNKPRPNFVLIQPDFVNSKTRNNHFLRYTDVKPKEERRPTVNELSNQRGITQKVNGWKLYFTASQIEELMEVEKDMQEQFTEVQAALSQIPTSKINSEEALKIHEMSQANIQRCQLIQNQLTDARASMIRTLDHKPRIQEIVNKHMSKRPIKKKERT